MAANSAHRKSPLTPEQAVNLYMHQLTAFEQSEIFNYTEIYFIGSHAKKHQGVIGGRNNGGYDDIEHLYIPVLHDHIAYRYEVQQVLGRGSFGQVVKAYDHKLHHHVAIKMIRNQKLYHQQAAQEIRILQHLRNQDKDDTMNIIHMLENFVFRNHVCIVFELLGMDLYEVIKKNNNQGLSLPLVKKIARSILQCLNSLHKNRIIHCDLKPDNILLKQHTSSDVKVIDFGSSCYNYQALSTYIQTRYYRAPEVILGGNCAMPIDMWSLGCVLAEILTGYPLILGADEGDQLVCMMELLGMPPENLLNSSKRARKFFTSVGHPRYCLRRCLSDGLVLLKGKHSRKGNFRGPPGSREFVSALMGCEDPLFLDFLKQCLEWDPELRMTPSQALQHPWLRRNMTT
ncbi:dual specificity tyrosine-phosphorylation-regulated kinase 2-like [Pelobates fuscus]|uniref:dual specificity tyrosine-phosphorylation-regulated kinase 2-like n=1 Tax=Pelobates fuscus TaxID=191477 RepID=UPI002FE4722A